MKEKNIKIMKDVMGVLILFQICVIILNMYVFYQSIPSEENTVLMLGIYIVGQVIGVVLRVGLSLLFWYSYNYKYKKEDSKDPIYRQVLAAFIYLSVIQVLNFGEGHYIIFIICTLYIKLKQINHDKIQYSNN